MEVEVRVNGRSWRWSLLVSVVLLNFCIPSLVLSYGVLLIHAVEFELPLWFGLCTPALYILTYGLTQCWFRDAADSWGGPVGHRVMASIGLVTVVSSLLACAFTPSIYHPLLYGILGGLGSSLISAVVDAVVFETYDYHLGILRGLCFTSQAVGQSVFPHIMSALINTYGYPFSYILLGGIMLQTLPAIMFLKIDETVRRPMSYSRYSDISKTYAIFGNGEYSAELQLKDMSGKSWKSPSDDNLHGLDFMNEVYENEIGSTITPPPSPEDKRRNIFGVEILPEIPEESENSEDEEGQNANGYSKKNKKRLSQAIKRLSIMGDNFSDYITKQIRRDSEISQSESREYSEVEVTYDNISPVTEIQREKIFNSFDYRCRSAYASIRRRIWMPSYRVYKVKRRLTYLMFNINDTFVKPLTRSLSCWRFYPSLLLCLSKLSLTATLLTTLPVIVNQMHPKISLTEINFLLTLLGFAWVCFMLCTPWLVQTPKRNFKYLTVLGLGMSTAACFLIAQGTSHDMFAIGCIVAGVGYGAVTACWEAAVQDFVGARKWPKLHSTLETTSGCLLAVFVLVNSLIVKYNGDLQYSIFILGIFMSIVTCVWTILSGVSMYANLRSFSFDIRWRK